MRSLKHVSLGFALPLLLLAPASAQKSTLKRALPTTTIAYVAFPDLDASIAEFRKTPLGRMWAEKEVQDFFADGIKAIEAHWQKGLKQAQKAHESGMLPFKPADLQKLRVHGLTLAMTSLEISDDEDRGPPKGSIGVMAHLDFGESAPIWRQIIDYGIAMLEQQGNAAGVTITREKVAGGEMVVMTDNANTDMEICVAFVGSGVVAGTLKREVVLALEALAGDQDVLTGSRAYKSTFRELDTTGAELEVFVQPRPVVDFGMKMLKILSEHPRFPDAIDVDGIGRVVEALGLRSIEAIGATSTYAGDRSISKSYTLAPAPTRKGLFAGASKILSLDFLKMVPKDAVSLSAHTFDLGSVYDVLVTAVKAYDPQLGEQVLGMLAGVEKDLGVSLKEDLIASLGHEFITWSLPMAAFGQPPPFFALMSVKDEQRLLKTLTTLCKLSDGRVELVPTERQGLKLHHLKIDIDSGGAPIDLSSLISPYIGFKNGYMAVAMSTSDIKRLFERLDRGDDPQGDIRANKEFAPYLEQFPKGDLYSLSFTDWKAEFEGIYQVVTSLAVFIPVGEDIPIDLSLLPEVGTLTKHLCGAISWSTGDGNGWKTHTASPWGPELAAMLVAGIGIGAGFVAESRFEQARARRPAAPAPQQPKK